jgi:hypothetical protein
VAKSARSTSQMPELSISKGKITLNTKAMLWVLGSLLAGGGVFGAVRLATTADVAAAEKRVEKKVNKQKGEHATVHFKLDTQVQKVEAVQTQLKQTVSEVQEVQHWQVADQAAERVSKKAPTHKREEVRMGLFKENISRLKNKKTPCANLDCTN